ncbi:MAG: thioredoxin [Verrucomicrobiota bacterium]
MAHESILELTSDNFESEVKSSDVPVLVDFWAEWCGPCKMLGPILDELAEEKGDAVKIGKVDVDSQQQLAAEYGIRSIPHLVFFKGGEVVDQHTGLASKADLAARFEKIG